MPDRITGVLSRLPRRGQGFLTLGPCFAGLSKIGPRLSRFHPRGRRTPSCQTPVRDGLYQAVCFPSIDDSNPSPAEITTAFCCDSFGSCWKNRFDQPASGAHKPLVPKRQTERVHALLRVLCSGRGDGYAPL